MSWLALVLILTVAGPGRCSKALLCSQHITVLFPRPQSATSILHTDNTQHYKALDVAINWNRSFCVSKHLVSDVFSISYICYIILYPLIVSPVATSSLYITFVMLHMQHVSMCTLCSGGDKLANYSDLTPRTGPSQYPPNQAKWQLLALMRFLWTKSNSVCLQKCRHQDLSTTGE